MTYKRDLIISITYYLSQICSIFLSGSWIPGAGTAAVRIWHEPGQNLPKALHFAKLFAKLPNLGNADNNQTTETNTAFYFCPPK